MTARSFFCLFMVFFTAFTAFPEEYSEYSIEDIMQVFELGRKETALYMLQQKYKKYPANEEVLIKLCEMALDDKNWAYAIELLEKLADLKPGDVNVRHVLMDIYKAYEMSIQEIITAREILKIDPDNLEILNRLTHLYHEQYMIREEEEIRKKIATINPEDQENMKQLAILYAEEGEMWKEIQLREMIYKKFPENSLNKRRLAYLYDKDQDLFHKLLMLEEILNESDTALPRIKAEYKNTKREYKRNMNLADVFESYSKFDVLETFDEWVFTITEGLFHKTFALKSNSYVKLNLDYLEIYNVPKNNPETNYNVGKITLGGIYHTAAKDNKTNFSLTGGVDSINIFKLAESVSYPEYTSDYFTFKATENNKFFPFIELNFHTEIEQYLYLDLYFYSTHIDEVESYIKPLRNNELGTGLYLLFPDSTLFLIGCEMHWIWEVLIRYRLTAEFFYVLYATNSIYDYNGNRTGYLKDIPDTQIDFAFTFDLYNNARLIPFYSDEEINLNYAAILGLHRIFRECFILRIEGTGEVSNTLEYAAGANLGLSYQNLERNFLAKVNLYYRYLNTLPLSGEEVLTPGHNFGIEFLINFNTY